jgi:hypothetical protein
MRTLKKNIDDMLQITRNENLFCYLLIHLPIYYIVTTYICYLLTSFSPTIEGVGIISLAISKREINGYNVPFTCTANSFLVLYKYDYLRPLHLEL